MALLERLHTNLNNVYCVPSIDSPKGENNFTPFRLSYFPISSYNFNPFSLPSHRPHRLYGVCWQTILFYYIHLYAPSIYELASPTECTLPRIVCNMRLGRHEVYSFAWQVYKYEPQSESLLLLHTAGGGLPNGTVSNFTWSSSHCK